MRHNPDNSNKDASCEKKVGLYFGSFNPIHCGHLNLANFLIDHQLVDEVWLVVSPNNPLKEASGLLDHNIRYELTQLAINENPRLKVSDIEFSMPVPSYTVDTLNAFSVRYPAFCFYLLIGSDNALLFDKWKDYQSILDKYPVLVYPRRGYDFSAVATKYPQMQLLDTPFYDISSTEIRNKILADKDVSGFLHPEVNQYIRDNRLYK